MRMSSKYCDVNGGCLVCEHLMCEGKDMENEMPKIYHCQNCGKEIKSVECYESAKILRNRIPNDNSSIFDIWFMDYCNDCAKTMNLKDIHTGGDES